MKEIKKKPYWFAWTMILLCALSLTACGGEAGGLEAMEAENASLREQISALEGENASLREQVSQLEGEAAALRAQAEETENGDSSPASNPIDCFYNTVETDGSTVSMNLVGASREEAWRAETRHLAEKLKDQLPLKEDQELVDAYLAAAEEQAGRMDVMAIYPVSDVTVPQVERISFSGSLRGVLWTGSRAQIWKDTFWQLRYILPDAASYTFVFDAEAVQRELEVSLNGD